MFSDEDSRYMLEAIEEAKGGAAEVGEVPIGAVVVCNGEIIGRGSNRKNTGKSALKHAEIIAIEDASSKIGDWRLDECSLYVTLEPCLMCAGGRSFMLGFAMLFSERQSQNSVELSH